jgi:hypothetical protein
MSKFGTAKSNLKTYNQAKKRKEKVEGLLSDAKDLYSAADNLINKDVSSSGTLLKLAYKGTIRIANLLPDPFVSKYLAYHQPGIDALASILVAKNKANFIENWYKASVAASENFASASKAILKKNKIVHSMTNQDGKYPQNLPPDFAAYFKLLFPEGQNSEHALMMDAGRGIRIEESNDELGLIICTRARDIASVHLNMSSKFHGFAKNGDKAQKYHQSLLKSNEAGESIAGLSATRNLQYAEFEKMRDNKGNYGHLTAFMEGKWRTSSTFVEAETAIHNLGKLSKSWNQWAKTVTTGSHMLDY